MAAAFFSGISQLAAKLIFNVMSAWRKAANQLWQHQPAGSWQLSRKPVARRFSSRASWPASQRYWRGASSAGAPVMKGE